MTGCSPLLKERVEMRYIHDTLAVHHRDSILALAAVGWRRELLWVMGKAAGLFG